MSRFSEEHPPSKLSTWPAGDVTHVIAWCGNWLHGCSGKARLAIAELDNPDMTAAELGRRLRCSRCGCRGALVTPDRTEPRTGLRD